MRITGSFFVLFCECKGNLMKLQSEDLIFGSKFSKKISKILIKLLFRVSVHEDIASNYCEIIKIAGICVSTHRKLNILNK